MPRPMAFLQTDADTFALSHGPLTPLSYPRPGCAAFFAPDFSLATDRAWWLDAGSPAPATLSRREWRDRFCPPVEPPAPLAWEAPDEGRFRAAFDLLRERLAQGVLRKGVPVTTMRCRLDEGPASVLFDRMLSRVPALPPALMAYGVYLPAGHSGCGSLEFSIGATPELLFELTSGDRLRTMAVAGTRTHDAEAGQLETSPKDRDEHQSVVEDLLGQLSGWGDAHATRTEVRRFGELQHLVAEISLAARQPLDFEAVARSLHPTPALGVYPRGAAGSAWLDAIDPGRARGRFGAPFGLRLPSGGGRCLVAIRSVQYRFGYLEIWAGCGVVPMSRYDEEWQEVQHKMRAVRTLWGV